MESTWKPLGHLPVSFSPLSFVLCVFHSRFPISMLSLLKCIEHEKYCPSGSLCSDTFSEIVLFHMNFCFMLGKHTCIEHTDKQSFSCLQKINLWVMSVSHADQFQRSLKGILICTLGKPEYEEQQKLQFLEFSYLFDFLQRSVRTYLDGVNGRSRRPMTQAGDFLCTQEVCPPKVGPS